jgi:hypothetical protein
MAFHHNTISNFASGEAYHEGRPLLRNLQGIARASGAEMKEANVVQVSGRYPRFVIRTDKSYRTKDKSEYHARTLLFANPNIMLGHSCLPQAPLESIPK